MDTLQKIAIIIFLCSTALMLLAWSLPFRENGILHKIKSLLIQYGFDNFWALFAPDTPTGTFKVGFEIQLHSGKRIPWQIPELTEPNKAGVRYIKLFNLLTRIRDAAASEGICNHIINQYTLQNPTAEWPVAINIIRYYVPDPARNPLNLPWYSEVVFTYSVNSRDGRFS